MVTRRCAFLDRDGVINVKQPEGEYVTSWNKFQLIPEIVDVIRLFNALDYLVIVVTNQRGIARGIMQSADLETIHQQMCEQLQTLGARIDDIYFCPHNEGECNCRKPRPGMVQAACQKWNIDLTNSIMLGDSKCDRELAQNCGLRFVLMKHGRIQETVPVVA
jgi:histidinol-phosphate phosphatase family protein